MSLRLPDLDDRSYSELVQEGIALIPRFAPSWTNHNASDPGITLLELFAFVTEGLIYQLNRVSDQNKTRFLKLLTGNAPDGLDHDSLEDALREAALGFRTPTRAVTCEDFERIAQEATHSDPADRQVKRCKSFPRCDLESNIDIEKQRDLPGHTSVVFVPGNPWASSETVQEIRSKLQQYFEPRRLLTSRVHVYGPKYLDVGVHIQLVPRSRSSSIAFEKAMLQKIQDFFDPLRGGPELTGWPWGRSIYTSDVFQLIEDANGLEYIAHIDFEVSSQDRLQHNEIGEVVEVRLQPEELVRIRVSGFPFSTALIS